MTQNKTTEKTPDELYKELYDRCKAVFSAEELASIEKAYRLASDAHKAQLRYSGQPYIIHPIAVANILLDFGMDAQSVAAAILHDTVEDTDIELEGLEKEFGKEIASLVDGVTKLGRVPLSTKRSSRRKISEKCCSPCRTI